MRNAEHNAREFLSIWQFWMVLAFFGLAAVLVYSIHLSNVQTRQEAARVATAKAANTTQVAQCFDTVKNAPIVRGFLLSHEDLIKNGILANKAALAVAPDLDPLHTVRVESLRRLRKAKVNADKLKRLIKKTTPTRVKCFRLAHNLNIDASLYVHKVKKTIK